MGIVLRGCAKSKDGSLVLVGTMPRPHSKKNVNGGNDHRRLIKINRVPMRIVLLCR